jgi:hypothetical protein
MVEDCWWKWEKWEEKANCEGLVGAMRLRLDDEDDGCIGNVVSKGGPYWTRFGQDMAKMEIENAISLEWLKR